MEKQGLAVRLSVSGKNRFLAECELLPGDCTYSLHLYCNGALVDRSYYTEKNSVVFWPTEPGKYYVKAVVLDAEKSKHTGISETVAFHGIYGSIEIHADRPVKQSVWRSFIHVFLEIFKNRERIIRVSFYDYAAKNRDSYLGRFWGLLSPLIQVGTYWFVFGLGIRGGSPVNGFPFVVWMLCGLVPWFYFSAGITKGAASVYSKAGLVLRLRYPKATLPVGSIVTELYEHVMLTFIMLVAFAFFGIFPSLYWLNVIYYEIYAFFLLTALAMITSTLTMIARDFQKLINSLILMLFYLTPILWTIDSLPVAIRTVLRANPILYVVDGYRDSLLYRQNFWEKPLHIVVFWLGAEVLMLFGCSLQQRYKDQFIDML